MNLDNKTKTKIKKIIKENGYDNYYYMGTWDEYSVFDPYFYSSTTFTPQCVGYPSFLLYNNNDFRWSNNEECFKILDYFYGDDEKDDLDYILNENRLNIIETNDNQKLISGIASDLTINQKADLLICSFEQDTTQIIENLISSISKTKTTDKNLSNNEWKNIANAINKLKDSPIAISDNCSGLKDITYSINKFSKEYNNCHKKLVIIKDDDHLNSNPSINDKLDAISKEINIPIVVLKPSSNAI